MNDTTVRDDGHAGDRDRVSPWFTDSPSGEVSEPPQGIETAADESAADESAADETTAAVSASDSAVQHAEERRAGESAVEPESVAAQHIAVDHEAAEHDGADYDGEYVDDESGAYDGESGAYDGESGAYDGESGAYAEDYPDYGEDYADWDGEYDLVYEDDAAGGDQRARRNRLGVAALVLGLVGLFPIGLVLGVIALLRRRRRKVAALSAVLLAVAWSVGVGTFWGQLGTAVPRAQAYGAKVLSLVRGGAEAVRENGAQSGNSFGDGVFALHVGDCFLSTPGPDGRPVTHAVACDQPHAGQVFHQFDLPDRYYPDQDSIETAAMSTCHTWSNQVLDKRRISPAMQLQAAFPQRLALVAGHRTVSCVVSEQGGLLTSSMLLP